MSSIAEVVSVTVSSETSFPDVRDLNTIAILSEHTRFAETYRIYEDIDGMVDDGFSTLDFAYQAANGIFQQNPRAKKVVVGKKLLADDYDVAVGKLISANKNFQFLVADATDDADILAIASYIETTDKQYGFSTQDADVVNAVSGNIVEQIQDLNYKRTMYMFHNAGSVPSESPPVLTVVPMANVMGRFAPEPAGSITWRVKTIVGIVADNLTATQEANLKAYNCMYYSTIEGVDVLLGDAKVASGEYIDVVLGINWSVSDLQARIFTLFLNTNKVNYTNAGAAAIEAEVRNMIQAGIDRNIFAAYPAPIVKVPNVLALTPSQRNSRTLPSVTFRARLAGAIHDTDIVGSVYP